MEQQLETNTDSKRNSQKGAIIVEASISLTVFMFMMFTMLSLIQVAYTQSRISTALCAATKQIAQYTHIFYVMDMDASFTGGSGKSSELFNNMSEFLENIGGNLGSVSSELGEILTNAGGALGGDSLTDYLKAAIGDGLVLMMIKKNLVTGTSQTAEDFFRMNHVKNLSLIQSKFLEGDSQDIFMRVTYDVSVAKFFKSDFGTFHMSSYALTKAWGDQKGTGNPGGKQ